MVIHQGSVRRTWQLVVLTTALAACTRVGGPAPIYDRANPNAPRPQPVVAAAVSSGGTHVVRLGDSIYELSRASGVPVRAIIDANGLRPPYTLYVGQRLVLPASRRHTVVRGDTISAIAGRYDVDMASIVRLNRIRPPYTIYVGQQLVLPGGAHLPQVQVAGRPEAVRPAPAARATPAGSQPLAAPRQPVRVALATPEPATVPSPQPRSKPAPPAPAGTAGKIPSGPVPTPPSLTGDGLVWPVRGRVLSGFGAQSAGQRNDGVNIAAPRGTPVLAAENGVVAYADSEINGFGKLLLIKHEGGLITAYAHNEALLVRRGDVVRRGQVVARVGTTGGVTTPQLHFEVRRGAKAVDPRRFLATS